MTHLYIVDDQRAVVNLWARGFRQMGYEVTTAYSGREAIKSLKKEETLPDLIILDQIMEYGLGIDVVNALEELDPEHKVKVVLVTAEPEIHTPELETKVNKVVFKPIVFRELVAVVDESLESSDADASKDEPPRMF